MIWDKFYFIWYLCRYCRHVSGAATFARSTSWLVLIINWLQNVFDVAYMPSTKQTEWSVLYLKFFNGRLPAQNSLPLMVQTILLDFSNDGAVDWFCMQLRWRLNDCGSKPLVIKTYETKWWSTVDVELRQLSHAAC